ncbi:MAG: hypothetical protein EPN45_21210 [Rhizobiaceae bacterium]|nr:MAG: hypothetical protein EPN45_21210 [Rhizobiaceae bacterium]
MNTDLLHEIRNFLAESKMGNSYFGKAACGNSELVNRLENGRTITLETAEKVRAFIAARRKSSDSERAA